MLNRATQLHDLDKIRLEDFQNFLESIQESKEIESAWFLGPKAENTEVLNQLLTQILKSIKEGREKFHPNDSEYITSNIKKSGEYQQAIQAISNNLEHLLMILNKYDTPFYSMRYQAQMNWELTLPAIVGYFATMLHNPNNVTVEASTATTFIEMAIGRDICQMIGFDNKSWSHITTDGSVANLEAMWSTRELKTLPLGIKEALLHEPKFVNAKDLTINLPNGSQKTFIELDSWQLLNLTSDEILNIPNTIAIKCKLKPFDVWNFINNNYSLNAIGTIDFYKKYLKEYKPAILVPSTKHYSWIKAAAILGFGYDTPKESNPFNRSFINIFVDEKARMNMDQFQAALDFCSEEKNKTPLILSVAVMGSTEESAVDPLKRIIDLREIYRKEKNFDFNIHADAAYGGYLLSTMRKNYPIQWPFHGEEYQNSEPFLENTSAVPLNKHVISNMQYIRFADSVTIDPHKWGYIPYAAGSLSYKNKDMINLVTFGASYIGSPGSLPSVGDFGIEGSKAGAAPAAVFLSHSVIRPSVQGYGKVISNAIINSKLFYLYLMMMVQENDPFIIVPLAKWPTNNEFADEKSLILYIRQYLKSNSLPNIVNESKFRYIFNEIGSDMNMIDFMFNFFDNNGKINTNINCINKFNAQIHEMLHIQPEIPTGQINLMVSMTTFERKNYGDIFINDLASRLKANPVQSVSQINCLRSTVLDPWLIDVGDKHKNFLSETIIPELKKTVMQAVQKIRLECDA